MSSSSQRGKTDAILELLNKLHDRNVGKRQTKKPARFVTEAAEKEHPTKKSRHVGDNKAKAAAHMVIAQDDLESLSGVIETLPEYQRPISTSNREFDEKAAAHMVISPDGLESLSGVIETLPEYQGAVSRPATPHTSRASSLTTTPRSNKGGKSKKRKSKKGGKSKKSRKYKK